MKSRHCLCIIVIKNCKKKLYGYCGQVTDNLLSAILTIAAAASMNCLFFALQRRHIPTHPQQM